MMMALLMTTVMVLGLSNVACNDEHTDDVDIVNKLVLTIPINDGEQDTDSCAPETVKYYQVSGFDRDGNCTYSEQFARNNVNTKDNITSLTLRKGHNKRGEVIGVTYGTKTMLINYLDADNEFLGYTLMTGLDLSSSAYKELIVDNIVPIGLAKQVDAIALDLTSNIDSSAEYAAKDAVLNDDEAADDQAADDQAADDQAADDEEENFCEAVVDDTVTIHGKLNVKTNPGVTDDFITLDATDSSLMKYEITSQTPDDSENEDASTVIKQWNEQAGTYRCLNAGSAVVTVTYSTLKPGQAFTIAVVNHDITGFVNVTIDAAALSQFKDISYVQFTAKDASLNQKVAVSDGKFTLNDLYTCNYKQTVTFLNAAGEEVGTGTLPAYKITKVGGTANVTITDVEADPEANKEDEQADDQGDDQADDQGDDQADDQGDDQGDDQADDQGEDEPLIPPGDEDAPKA
jgi:hypothetical protein